MAESFCIIKQGRGRGGLFKWFSKAEFSLCDAPRVAGGRSCASLLLNMSSALHKMLHRAQISLLLCCFFGVCIVHTHICHLIHTDLFTIVNLRTCEVAIKCWGHIFFSCSWILLLLAWVGYVTMIVSFDALRVCSWICQWANVGGGGLWFTYRGHKRNSF